MSKYAKAKQHQEDYRRIAEYTTREPKMIYAADSDGKHIAVKLRSDGNFQIYCPINNRIGPIIIEPDTLKGMVNWGHDLFRHDLPRNQGDK